MSHTIKDLSSLVKTQTHPSLMWALEMIWLFAFLWFLPLSRVISSLTCMYSYWNKGSRGLCKPLNNSFSLSLSPLPSPFSFSLCPPKRFWPPSLSSYLHFLYSAKPPGFVWVFPPPTEDWKMPPDGKPNGAIGSPCLVFLLPGSPGPVIQCFENIVFQILVV